MAADVAEQKPDFQVCFPWKLRLRDYLIQYKTRKQLFHYE